MYNDRFLMYRKLEHSLKSKLLVYVTGDRINMSSQIAPDVIDFLINQLDKIGTAGKISLYLYTRGGDVAAAWNVVNLLRMYCDKLQVIVPHKALSAGTIICLGADEIIMTKQATLGPIDPSVNNPLNPIAQRTQQQISVSVEAVNGYIEYAKNELGIKDDETLGKIYEKLSDVVHPLVLGQAYRSRSQIQMLAKKLLKHQVKDEEKIDRIIEFLCSESGSHDYTINRREACEDLKLKVKKPTLNQYKLIKQIYDDISSELELTTMFDVTKTNGHYICKRCLLESIDGGADRFITEGDIRHNVPQPGMNGGPLGILNNVTFEGWRKEEIPTGNLKRKKVVNGNGYVECKQLEI